MEHAEQVARVQHRLAVLRINRRQIEEVVVHARLHPRLVLLEEGGDEVALAVQPALWRVLEHGGRSVAKVGAGDGLATTIDILVVEPDVRQDLEGIFDLGRGEGQFAAGPLVVVVQRRGAQHDVLDPVGRRPAGAPAAFNTDAPGRVAVGHNLVLELLQLVPGLGNLVSGVIKVFLGIPYRALEVDALEDPAQDFAAGTVDRVSIEKALLVVGLQPVLVDDLIEVDYLALLGIAAHSARLGEVDDIFDGAGCYLDSKAFYCGSGHELDRNAGLVLEILKGGFELGLFIAG